MNTARNDRWQLRLAPEVNEFAPRWDALQQRTQPHALQRASSLICRLRSRHRIAPARADVDSGFEACWRSCGTTLRQKVEAGGATPRMPSLHGWLQRRHSKPAA